MSGVSAKAIEVQDRRRSADGHAANAPDHFVSSRVGGEDDGLTGGWPQGPGLRHVDPR